MYNFILFVCFVNKETLGTFRVYLMELFKHKSTESSVMCGHVDTKDHQRLSMLYSCFLGGTCYVACRILVLQPGIELRSTAVRVPIPNH